jgi:hypothetical protein
VRRSKEDPSGLRIGGSGCGGSRVLDLRLYSLVAAVADVQPCTLDAVFEDLADGELSG